MRQNRTWFSWMVAGGSVLFNMAAGCIVGEGMATAPLGFFVVGLLPLAVWCVIRAEMWQETMSRAGTIAGIVCLLLPMADALRHEKYRDLPLPLTFSERALPLQQALAELRDAGFEIEPGAWKDSSRTIRLSARRPSFDELDLALRIAGVHVQIDYDFAGWTMTLGPRARGTWKIRVLDGVRYGPIRWVQRDLRSEPGARKTG